MQNNCDMSSMRDCGDRFDETLCQTILNNLTFAEKVMFECICKKWQKVIYKKQRELRLNGLDDDEEFDSLNKLQEPIQVIDFNTGAAKDFGMKSVNKLALTTVLNKCGNYIEEIYLWCYIDEEVLRIIERYCPNIKIFMISMVGLDETSLVEFGKRVGHKFEYVELYSCEYLSKISKKFLRYCPNVKDVYVSHLEELICEDQDFLPNLEILFTIEINDKNYKFAEILAKKYLNILKKLTIYSEYCLPIEIWKNTLQNVSELRRLESLDLTMPLDDDNKVSINDYIVRISQNSPQVKDLALCLRGKGWDDSTLLTSIARLESLVKLELDIRTGVKLETNISCLKSCKNLQSFSLNITSKEFDESFFDGIDQSLVSLREFDLSFRTDLSDKTIALLSGLKNLRSICLIHFDSKYLKNITDKSVCQLFLRCPLINRIRFDSNPNITHKTIETLISCAMERPKIDIRFDCDIAEGHEEHGTNVLTLNQYMGQIPQNLIIAGTFFA